METPEPAVSTSRSIDAIDAELVPGWLRRLAAISWRSIAALALGGVLVAIALKLSTVTFAVIIGAIVAATLAPYVHALEVKRGWSATKATIVVCLVSAAVVVVGLIVLVLAFLPYVTSMVGLLEQGEAALREWFASLGLPEPLVDVVNRAVDFVRTSLAGAIADLVGPIADLVTILLLAAFLVFFYLQGGERAWHSAGSKMAPWREEILFVRGRDALARVGGYLRGTAILAAAHAATDFVYLTLLGVPLAGPLSVLIFALTFIPYLGGIVGTILLILVAAATVGGTKTFILFVLIGVTNAIVNSILRPIVYGKTVKIHPALVLIALPTGAALFGIAGLFIALPVLAFAMAIVPGLIQVLSTGPEASDEHALVPLWLERLGAWSWRGLFVVALLAVIVEAILVVPVVVVALVLALVFAATLEPLAARLRARGMRRTTAAIVATVGMVLVVVVITAITLLSIVQSMPAIFDTAQQGASKTGIASVLLDFVKGFRSGLFGAIGDIASTVSGLGVGIFLATLLTFYLLRDGAKWGRALLAKIDSPVRRNSLGKVGADAADVLSGYMTGTGIISAVGAASQFAIMFILGIPLAAPLAVLSFFGGFIPYIGSALTTGLALLVTIAVGSPTAIIVMIVFTAVFNIVQGNIVAPVVYSRTVHIHPAIVLMAIPAGAALAGIIGMFLAVPFLGVISVTWNAVLHAFDPDDMLVASPADAVEASQPPASSLGPPLVDAGGAQPPRTPRQVGTASADANP